MNIDSFIKVIYWIQICYQVTFSMSKVNSRLLSFIETKSWNIDLFTNKIKISSSIIGVKFLRRKEKKVFC